MRWIVLLTFLGICGAENVCAPCHPKQSRPNAMTKTLRRAGDIKKLAFVESNYRTSIEGSTLAVSDGKDTLQLPIQWIFGVGRAGQTYVFEHKGQMYESRLSYYSAPKELDLTLGAHQSKPTTLIEAAGRPMDKTDVRECFGCHSSAGAPGVTCENCHGSAAGHVKSKTKMRKLSSLTSEETNELCGSCHRTWGQVAQMDLRGPMNVRFQPYRITNSKCFDAEDRRIACTACHDPHGELATAPESYDSKCSACHSLKPAGRTSEPRTLESGRSARVCPTAKKACVTCHMPKVGLPGSHFDFADHQIRIARKGDPYPN